MADELKTILIKDLQEAESAADTDYIAIDNGTVTKKIRVENYNKTANGTAKSYAESAKESADKAQRNADSISSTISEITNNITAAQSAAIQAEKSAEAAESATSNLQTYVNSAKESAEKAKTSEESTKNVADKIADSNKIAQSYAVGGTNYRTGEDTDNARYYYSGAKTAEANSETYKSNAAASESAAATSEINAKTSETNAAKSATSASSSAESATTSKDAAATSEQNASNSANYARANATRAESYAIGGTSSRSGEDTDNAKYYAQQAKKSAELAAGSITGVSSLNGRTGAVTINKSDVGLGNVDNTSDADKPVSTAVQTSLSAETTRAKKAEEANTQLTNDLKTGLTSGTVKVAKATVADSASSLGKVTTYQTWIPDNGGRRKYLLMYDITDWISAKSNASTRAFDGYFFSRRGYGYVGTNYTGNLSIVASHNGVYPDGSPIKSDNDYSLRLRTTSSTYVPGILHQKSNDKYYLSLMTNGSERDLILFGIFQGTFIGTWINNEGADGSNGTLPSDYEEYSDGFYSIPYEKAVCDKNGKDITEYLVAAAYADGAFTFTRGNGNKTALTIPDASSSADGLMSKADKAKLDGVADQTSQLAKNTAQIETAGTATNAHSVGEYVMISNALYKVTAAVAKGDTWTIGTNVTAANVGSEISSLKSDLANHSALHVLPLSDIADAQNGFDIQSCDVAVQGKIVLCWLSFGIDNISIPQWDNFAFAKLKSGYYPVKAGSTGPVGIIQEQTTGLTGTIRVYDNAIYINTHGVSFNSGGWCWGFIAYVLD